jgi:dTDP-N-acetylfucosamine:lipid II N-acetylfucosaminyltransferase
LCKKKILHLCRTHNQVLKVYLELLEKNNKLNEPFDQVVLIEADIWKNLLECDLQKEFKNIKIEILNGSKIIKSLKIIKMALSSDKLIVHYLDTAILKIAFILPFILRKMIWVIWGGDLYAVNKKNKNLKFIISTYLRKNIVKRIPYVITRMEYDNLIKFYNTSPKLLKAYYPISFDLELLNRALAQKNSNSQNVIMIGNSACPTNKHFEMIDKIKELNYSNFKVIAPLSYSGKEDYIRLVSQYGKKQLGVRFQPLLEYQKPAEYINIIKNVDVAIMNHERQRGLGILLPLLYLGKVIYLNSETSIYKYLANDLGVKIFDTKKFFKGECKLIPDDFSNLAELNRKIILENFSNNFIVEQWKKVFDIV